MSARTIVASMLDATPAVSGGFVVGAAGRTLTLPSGEVHDLTRHGPLRRILWALAIAKERRSGAAMSTLELVEVGWPGEKMRHEAATLRVYTTIRRMRRLGLGDALVTRDDGYLIDPDVPIATEPEPAAG
jgi:hypothetical protein